MHLGLENNPGSSEGNEMGRKSESIPEDARQSGMAKQALGMMGPLIASCACIDLHSGPMERSIAELYADSR